MLPLLLALCVWVCATAQPLHHVSGALNSWINLTTGFPRHDVKEMSWMYENNNIRLRIAKIKNGIMVENRGNRYTQFCNGTVLGIPNLTSNDYGLYIADSTLSDDTSHEMKFNVTLPVTEPTPAVVNSTGQNKEHFPEEEKKLDPIPKIIYTIVAFVVVIVIIVVVWKSRRRSSRTRGQDARTEDRRTSQNRNVHENEENFTTPDEEASLLRKLANIIFYLCHKETQVSVFYKSSEECSGSKVTNISPDPSEKYTAKKLINIQSDLSNHESSKLIGLGDTD